MKQLIKTMQSEMAAQNLSQAELARLSGVPVSSIHLWMKDGGTISGKNLLKLLTFFKLLKV